ncbi:hypothetical protein [Pseudomonas moorei]|uniref:hypothetical protein n=1 Tax=Pseudomonas moorei TaxID=395599 RepID=UPI0036F1B5CE
MSLESSIADLTTEAKNLIAYFNAKKASIDAAVAAAIAAAPETLRTWYVDQVNGLDTNSGTSMAAPFKTIGKALASTPAFGVATVQLLSDYTFNEVITQNTANLVVVGNGVVRNLYPKYYQVLGSDGVTQSTVMGGFQLVTQGSNIEFRNCNLVLPTIVGVAPVPTVNRSTGFVRTNGTGNVPPFLGVALSSIAVTMAPDFIGSLIGATVASISLTAINSTFPSGFGGKFIGGIASGTLPKDTSNVMSNISAL